MWIARRPIKKNTAVCMLIFLPIKYNNVPISSISQILGHNNIKTTEIYITKDTTHLRELTLEVPNG